MKRSVFTTGTWLVLAGAALLVTAGILNFAQRLRQETPAWDGISWTDTNQGIIADNVAPGSSGAHGRIVPGDHLIAISVDNRKYERVYRASDVQMYLDRARVGGDIHYFIERPSYPEESRYYYADLSGLDSIHKWTPSDLYVNVIGLVYLFVGFFVLFKQGGRAPFALHFASLCLAAFVFHSYNPVGTFRDLDLAIAFLRNAAFILFPPLFLHFCLVYPQRQQLFSEKRSRALLLYSPAIVLLLLACVVFLRGEVAKLVGLPRVPTVSDNFIGFFYKLSFVHFVLGLTGGVFFLVRTWTRAKSAVVRQQMKWVIWGSVLAVAPFALLYSAGFLLGAEADPWLTNVAVLPLILIPLAFGYSVVRYRLMDVELVVRRVFVYVLTTLAIALMVGSVVYFAGIYALGGDHPSTTSGEITLSVVIAIVAMAAIVMIAAPVKTFLQERIDRMFYGERYDMRHSLLDFGRTLSATTALDPLLDSLVSRLQQVMNVGRVAIFIEDKNSEAGYRVARSAGLSGEMVVPPDFREMIRIRSAESGVVRTDDLDLIPETTGFVRRALHYYVPCVVRGRMVAVIGLGRSADGALLSSEDIDILLTVSGYVAVAIENSLLYQEQQERAGELKLLKEFNESIIESINVGLLAVDLNGCVTRLNSALEEILDLSRAEAVGKRVEDLFSEDFTDTLRQVLGNDRWQLREIRNIYKIHTATRGGRSLVLNIAIAPLQDSLEQTGALVVLEDVTSRIRLEEQLQQREKLSSIGLLAAGVAHEVNTPLTGVSSYTQMLLGMLAETDPKHALLLKVRRQAERATNIVNNLLNFSRTGGATEFSEVDISRVLDDTLQLLEPQLRGNQIEIIRAYDPESPRVFGNSGQLQQVFTNLLINARDATPDGGSIRISTIPADDHSVMVEVSDSGTGIAPENVAKIYDPFYTTKGVGEGTGLGLAVSYGIVQEHSGHISVESAPGRGTTFRITLPTAHARMRLQAVGE
ncbi:MAG: PAS domain S-box protein [Pyrinomonadaceae bacterium]|nr:PAS domain S-box protein [Pyrinomonadaceae bacterium]